MIVDIKMTCAAAPLALEGTIDAIPFYFRNRHSFWRVEFPKGKIVAEGTGDLSNEQAIALVIEHTALADRIFQAYWDSDL